MKRNNVPNGSVFYLNNGASATVIRYLNNKDVLIEFNDSYKHRLTVSLDNLLKKKVKNPYSPSVCGVGFVGSGDFLVTDPLTKKVTYTYIAWSNMINRCYRNDYESRDRSYEDCSVCNDWHNFQNFAKWYSQQPESKLNYELDKDLFFSDNKIYSPSTCILIPKEINLLLADRLDYRGSQPLGVTAIHNGSRFVARISKNGIRCHLGSFLTASQAHEVYVLAKEAYAKEVANKWRGRIDERVYDALMSWRVSQ